MDTPPPAPRYIVIDRAQSVLRPVDVEALIPDDHFARTLWHLLGRLDLSRFAPRPKAVVAHAGRPAWEPRLLIAVWLYGLSRNVSSARQLARESAYEPGLQWLTGLEEINYHTLADFRVDHGAALDELFAQVLGVLQSQGLVTLQRLTQDGTKVRADADKSSFHKKEKLEEHLQAARAHVTALKTQAEQPKKQQAAQQRAAREREQRLTEALATLERLQKDKRLDKDKPCQASPTDPDAQFMRTADHGLAPCHNVQLSVDAAHKLIVAVAVTSQPSDAHQLQPALQRLQNGPGLPRQIIADGDYTNRANVIAAAERGVNFYGSWGAVKDAPPAKGIAPAYTSVAFVYQAEQDVLVCPEGQTLRLYQTVALAGTAQQRIYAAPRQACQSCAARPRCTPQNQLQKHGRAVTRLIEDERLTAFHAKMASEEAKAIYQQRSPVAEFPHAWLKTKLALRRFRTRGNARVKCEVLLAALTYNLQRLFRLQPQREWARS